MFLESRSKVKGGSYILLAITVKRIMFQTLQRKKMKAGNLE